MLALLKLELEKLFRAKSFYLSFVVLSAFVALMLWGFYTYAARKTGGQAVEQFKYTYESKQYFNGLTFALYSVLFSFTLLLPIFVSMSAGSQIASEARSGTLRMICTRPISRASLILSKFLVSALHAGLLLTFFIVLNLVVGLIFVGWGNLELYPGPLNLVDAPGKIMRDEALMRFAYAALSGTWALLVIVSLALLCSVVFESSGTGRRHDYRGVFGSLYRGPSRVLRAVAALLFHHRHGLLARRLQAGYSMAKSMALRMCLWRVHHRLIVDYPGHLRAEGYCDVICG